MSKYIDIAVKFSDNSTVFVPTDIFTCGLGLYACLRRLPFAPSEPVTKNNSVVMEIIDLEDRKLGKGLDDFCLIATSDIFAMMKAEQRRNSGLSNENLFSSLNLNAGRTLEDVEEGLGCSLLKHSGVLSALYYHDKIPK